MACQARALVDVEPFSDCERDDLSSYEAETDTDAPQPLKDAAAEAFIDLATCAASSLEPDSTSSVANNRPPSCTWVLKISPGVARARLVPG